MFIRNKTRRLRKQAQNEPTSHASFGACIHFKMKQITINSATKQELSDVWRKAQCSQNNDAHNELAKWKPLEFGPCFVS